MNDLNTGHNSTPPKDATAQHTELHIGDHVRLRPQVANELRKRETIFQCESCQRVLWIPPAQPASMPESEAEAGI